METRLTSFTLAQLQTWIGFDSTRIHVFSIVSTILDWHESTLPAQNEIGKTPGIEE